MEARSTAHPERAPHSTLPQQFLHGQSNIASNLPEQYRRNVPPLVERHRRHASIRVPELLVRTPLPYLYEAQSFEELDHFLGLEYRHRSHRYAT
nr:hypothetical protein [Rhodocaloribacter litoris]